jgi:hypothetical protein
VREIEIKSASLLITVEEMLARTGGVDAQLGSRVAGLDGPDLGVVEHPVALLAEEGHVNGEALGGSVALVAKGFLGLDVVLDAEKGARHEVPGCRTKGYLNRVVIGLSEGNPIDIYIYIYIYIYIHISLLLFLLAYSNSNLEKQLDGSCNVS